MSTAAWRRVAFVLLGVLVVLAYLGSLDSPFVYDDKIEVVGNATIRDLSEWKAVATYNVSRPLLVLSYAVDFHRHELTPRGYHVTNLILAVLAVGSALFSAEALLRLAGRSRPLLRAAAVAGLWAVHPMGTESITYITGRSELLCGLFCLLSVGAWARALAAEDAGGSAWAGAAWRLAGLLAFVGAVTSKEVGAMIPAAALVLELVLGRRGGRSLVGRLLGVRWAWYLPYALLVGGAAWLRMQHAETLLPREVDRPLAVQLVTQAEAWLHYLRLWALPWGQTIFHHLEDLDPAGLRAVGAVGGWLAMVVGAVIWGRREPVAGVALAAAALFLVPSSSIVPLKESMAEHRAFQTGFWLLLAVVASLRGRAARVGAWAAVPAAVALLGLTQLRHAAWQSEVSLWQEATERGPDVALAWYGLGDAARFSGELDEAAVAYRRALELDPDLRDAWNNLGITLAERGDLDAAEEAWRAVLKQSPSYCRAHANLGNLAMVRERWDEALTQFHSTLAYCPDNAIGHLGLCKLHYGPRRDPERAVFHCQAFLSLAPTSSEAQRVQEWLMELTF